MAARKARKSNVKRGSGRVKSARKGRGAGASRGERRKKTARKVKRAARLKPASKGPRRRSGKTVRAKPAKRGRDQGRKVARSTTVGRAKAARRGATVNRSRLKLKSRKSKAPASEAKRKRALRIAARKERAKVRATKAGLAKGKKGAARARASGRRTVVRRKQAKKLAKRSRKLVRTSSRRGVRKALLRSRRAGKVLTRGRKVKSPRVPMKPRSKPSKRKLKTGRGRGSLLRAGRRGPVRSRKVKPVMKLKSGKRGAERLVASKKPKIEAREAASRGVLVRGKQPTKPAAKPPAFLKAPIAPTATRPGKGQMALSAIEPQRADRKGARGSVPVPSGRMPAGRKGFAADPTQAAKSSAAERSAGSNKAQAPVFMPLRMRAPLMRPPGIPTGLEAPRAMLEDRAAAVEKRLRSQSESIQKEYLDRLYMSWIHHDSAIEGTVYTFSELRMAIDPSITVVPDSSIQPICDEIRRHRTAIDFVRETANKKRQPVSADLIKRIYLLLHPEEGDLKTVKYRKDIPQHRLYFHEYAAPDKIAYGVRQVVEWVNDPETKQTRSPVRIAARAHYDLLRAFPFPMDSGKVARLLMNLILVRAGFPPAIIHSTERQRYYEALRSSPTVIIAMVQEALENSVASIEKFLDERTARVRSFVS